MSNRSSSSTQTIQDTYQEKYLAEKDMEEIDCPGAEWSPSLEISEDRLDRQLSGLLQLSRLEEEEDWMTSWAWNFTILPFLAAAHPVVRNLDSL